MTLWVHIVFDYRNLYTMEFGMDFVKVVGVTYFLVALVKSFCIIVENSVIYYWWYFPIDKSI